MKLLWHLTLNSINNTYNPYYSAGILGKGDFICEGDVTPTDNGGETEIAAGPKLIFEQLNIFLVLVEHGWLESEQSLENEHSLSYQLKIALQPFHSATINTFLSPLPKFQL